MTTTLGPHLDRYFTARRRRGEINARTAQKQRRRMEVLNESFGRRPVEQFGPAAIDRYLEEIGHLAPASRRHYLSVARGFGRWMLTQGHIKNDPTAHVPKIHQPRRVPMTLTGEEVQKVLLSSPSRRSDAILWLMVGCGCRTIEVSRLQVEDYDPVKRLVRLIGKSDHERIIPVPEAAARAIDAYLDEVGRVAGPLIRSEKVPTRGLAPPTIGHLVRDLMTDSGVKVRPLDGRSAHGLRRTAASDVMERTGDVQLVQEMLGHSSIETTARHYLRRVPMERLRQAMEGRSYDGSESGEEDLSPPVLRAA